MLNCMIIMHYVNKNSGLTKLNWFNLGKTKGYKKKKVNKKQSNSNKSKYPFRIENINKSKRINYQESVHFKILLNSIKQMSRNMGKPTVCLGGENKGAVQGLITQSHLKLKIILRPI